MTPQPDSPSTDVASYTHGDPVGYLETHEHVLVPRIDGPVIRAAMGIAGTWGHPHAERARAVLVRLLTDDAWRFRNYVWESCLGAKATPIPELTDEDLGLTPADFEPDALSRVLRP